MADYSAADRLLHRLALGAPVLGEMLHDLERRRYLETAPPFEAGQHVFVTGLARAGTTLLMRELYATGAFGSLTYADMPLVLAPNLWQALGFAARRPQALKERAHGDGILVNTQSPEALDEVYWRQLSGTGYIGSEGLSPHEPDAAAIAGYRDLIRLILRRTGKTRYLSKNNNMLLRLAPLARAWPDAVFLVPLRDPLPHARSLLQQHQRFLQAGRFTRSYMTWLAHHEFGATHRPYLFEGAPQGDASGPDYWLAVWIAACRHAERAAAGQENILLVPYEDLCTNPEVWQAVLRRTGTAPQPMQEARAPAAERSLPRYGADLAAEAGVLYTRMRAAALERLLGSG
ncbi:sulfotransferase (plasmid) [Roseobacteraceae bacterium NS-SX3]